MRIHSSLALLALALATSSACIVHNPPPPEDPYGDIAFDWSFAGETDCSLAGVDEVDIAVFRAGELVLEVNEEPCVGGGLILTDILEGVYDVFVDAYDRNGQLLYAGEFNIRVRGGVTNDAGLVVLDLVGEPLPAVRTGELAFFWSFLYPTDNNVVIDCADAGVAEVAVTVTPLGQSGEGFTDIRDCTEEGIAIAPLPEGRYELELLGLGLYHGDDVLLYDSGVLVVDVFADTVADLGDVALARVDESFSDFDVAWSFVEDTCASAGVSEVVLAFTRIGFVEPEDVFAVDCHAASVLRRTFVPGSYVVSATADGAGLTWVASTTVDLPPSSVGQVDLALAPAP